MARHKSDNLKEKIVDFSFKNISGKLSGLLVESCIEIRMRCDFQEQIEINKLSTRDTQWNCFVDS